MKKILDLYASPASKHLMGLSYHFCYQIFIVLLKFNLPTCPSTVISPHLICSKKEGERDIFHISWKALELGVKLMVWGREGVFQDLADGI